MLLYNFVMKKINFFNIGLLIGVLFLFNNQSAAARDSIIPDPSIPQVTGVEAVKTTSSSVTLHWDPVPLVEGYEIDVSQNGTTVQTIRTKKTTKIIPELEANTTYTFQVLARIGEEYGEASDELEVTTNAAVTIPFDSDTMIANQLIVKIEKGKKLKTDYPKEKLLISKYTKHKYVLIKINDKTDSDKVIENLLKLPGVISIEYNGYYKMDTADPNDTYYSVDPSSATYGWQHLGYYEYGDEDGIATFTNEAWDHQTGSADIIIGIIDQGIDTDHPDLQDNIWVNPDEIASNGIDDDNNGFVDDINGWDFGNGEANPNPNLDGVDDDGDGYIDENAGHGTSVHGAAAPVGNNATGVVGSMWDASVMALQASTDADYGIKTSAAADSIYYAIENGADIINMSFGSTTNSSTLSSAVSAATDAGLFVVASAGNDPTMNLNETPRYPVCYDRVFGVSGFSLSSQEAYETYGSNCVDLVAPYDHFYTTSINTTTGEAKYTNTLGTSFAAPHVSGIAGLMLSEKNTLTRQEITNILIATVTKMDSIPADYGAGLVNGGAALAGVNCLNSDDSVKTIYTYYVDADGDGYGIDDIEYSCSTPAPTGTSENNTDCNDSDKSVNGKQTYYKDADGDGLGTSSNTTKVCSSTAPSGYVSNSSDKYDSDYDNDGVSTDNDCDDTDAEASDEVTYYYDYDGDGLGNSSYTASYCENTADSRYWVSNDDDENDSDYDNDGTVTDKDCNDKDSSVSKTTTYYKDVDGDGYGDVNSTTAVCSSSTTPPTGYVSNSTDCNDSDKDINSKKTYYKDADGDGLGNASSTASVCSNTAPSGYVSNSDDKNDSDYDNDGVSSSTDCNDKDSTISSNKTYYQDADGDGLGSSTVTTLACSTTAPTGYTTNNTDSNDNDFDNDGSETENDCNDRDDIINQEQTYYADDDADGLGDAAQPTSVCANQPPTGYVNNMNDNNDQQYSLYADNDPADETTYKNSVTDIAGATNGQIKVTFNDGSEYLYTIFDVETDTTTAVKSFNDTGYLVVLHPKAKTVALANVYTGEVFETETLSDQKWKSKSLKLSDLRADGSTEAIVTGKKETDVLVTVVKIKPDQSNKLSIKDNIKVQSGAVDAKKTKPKEKTIDLRNENKNVVITLKVSSEYQLSVTTTTNSFRSLIKSLFQH